MPRRKAASTITSMFGETAKAGARREAGRFCAKVVGKRISKTVAKSVARTAASPWLLIADGAELVVERAATAMDCSPSAVRIARRGAGLGTSVVAGAAVGGPVGAAAGAALWGVGELVSWMIG